MKDIDEIRRENIRLIELELGGPALAAKTIEMSAAQFANLRDGAKDSKTGKPRGMRKDTARKIESGAGKPQGWLDVDHSATAIATTKLTPSPVPGMPVVNVPILANSASMGHGVDQHHEDVIIGVLPLSEAWMRRTLQPTNVKHVRFIHAYGDSMSPTFEDGDIVLVDTGMRDARSIDGIYVIEANERLYIKRVRQRIDGEVEVSSDNPTVKTVDILNGDHPAMILGKVIYRWLGKKL